MTPILSVDAVSRSFGGLRAVSGVSFQVAEREVFGIIGPNGAGKTTLFNVLTGTIPASTGEIRFRDRPITGLAPDTIARSGMVRTFQATPLFRQATVWENVRRAHLFVRLGRPGDFLRRARVWAAQEAACAKADELLHFVGLAGVRNSPAGALGYGTQKLVGIAMALATDPVLMLMDEPAAGLNPSETAEITAVLARLRVERGLSIVLVEHDMRMVMGLSDRVLVLSQGQVICLGTPAAVQADAGVIEAYLGVDEDEPDRANHEAARL